ncbi:hypothetical protein HIM_09456 [Hirsutella minnesotensis 3608]|uniref:non-specific serine/threonine protein kinase n=1 Tax=Hirsutella minnesotensis 3608 TaxID=1043627 RepID=A0A0F7ZXR0_9HYPO|nr:hypothetical protein HIM_09456 [Hirsutella minnesotensis 3608]
MADEIESKTLFSVYSHATDFLLDPHHSKYLVQQRRVYLPDWARASPSPPDDEDREITPAPAREPSSLLCVTTNHNPAKGLAFTFGSSQQCDFLLATDSRGGISRLHFSISVQVESRTPVFILKNHSRYGTLINSPSLGSTELTSQRALIEGEEIRIDLAFFDLHVRIPEHSLHWELFRKNLSTYLDTVSKHVPLQCLQLDSEPSTRSHLTSTGSIYELTCTIGKGAHGTVRKGIDRATGKVVAAKQYYKVEHARTQEAMLLQRISHVNVVKFHAFMAIQGESPALIMELIDGNNLLQEHESSPLQHHEVVAVTKQLLNGLACMHSQNITHRDVKPANVMVVARDPILVKLTDFGLAVLTDTLKSFSGTPLYSAPEVMERRPFNEKVDIWSLGISALQLIYGLPEYPKSKVSYLGWPDKVLGYLDKRPRCLTTNFLVAMLTRDPKRRPSAKACLEHDLFRTPHAPQDSIYLVEQHLDEESTRPFTPNDPPTLLEPPILQSSGEASLSRLSLATAKDRDISREIVCQAAHQTRAACELPSQGLLVGSSMRQKEGAQDGESGREPLYAASTAGYRGMTISDFLDKNLWDPSTSAGQVEQRMASSQGDQDNTTILAPLSTQQEAPEWYQIQEGSRLVSEGLPDPNSELLQMPGSPIPSWNPYDPFETPTTGHPASDQPSHISSRSLRFDEGLVYIVYHRQRISMRIDDFRLNASQICTAAGLSEWNRRKYLDKIRAHSNVDIVRGRAIWVPFRDGVFLCQYLQLDSIADALFSQAPLPIPTKDENYFLALKSYADGEFVKNPRFKKGYMALSLRGLLFFFNTEERDVNVTHLLKLTDKATNVREFLRRHDSISRRSIVGGRSPERGTYMTPNHARQFCDFFEISHDAVDQIEKYFKAS